MLGYSPTHLCLVLLSSDLACMCETWDSVSHISALMALSVTCDFCDRIVLYCTLYCTKYNTINTDTCDHINFWIFVAPCDPLCAGFFILVLVTYLGLLDCHGHTVRSKCTYLYFKLIEALSKIQDRNTRMYASRINFWCFEGNGRPGYLIQRHRQWNKIM